MTNGILCIGEVPWDALPAGLFLGGAPFNVACHLNELGVETEFASRVGDDMLGAEIRRQMRGRGMSDDLLQIDAKLSTGFVIVSLAKTTGPAFEIVAPSAWDAVEPEPALIDRARSARAIVYGSLFQRAGKSRATLGKLLGGDALAVFDVNLRPPYDSREVVEASLAGADIVKLNDAEAVRLAEWFGWPAPNGSSDSLRETAARIAVKSGARAVAMTRGEHGAGLWRAGEWTEHPGYRVEVADTVGSGDAFLAALLEGWFAGKTSAEMLGWANAVGAYVATRQGATPRYDRSAIERIITSG